MSIRDIWILQGLEGVTCFFTTSSSRVQHYNKLINDCAEFFNNFAKRIYISTKANVNFSKHLFVIWDTKLMHTGRGGLVPQWDFFQEAPKVAAETKLLTKKNKKKRSINKVMMLGAPDCLRGPVGFFPPRYMASLPLHTDYTTQR
jgi:hypothetical protein